MSASWFLFWLLSAASFSLNESSFMILWVGVMAVSINRQGDWEISKQLVWYIVVLDNQDYNSDNCILANIDFNLPAYWSATNYVSRHKATHFIQTVCNALSVLVEISAFWFILISTNFYFRFFVWNWTANIYCAIEPS